MKVNYQNKELNLPDFLIVGAAKSGTTSLHYYLKENSNIFLPEIKESYFFSFFNEQPKFKSPDPLYDVISNIDTYTSQYPSDFDGLMGDASPSYLYAYEKTIANIKEIYGDKYKNLKIIILLRNPIDRAWSQYMHFRKNYNEPLDFVEAIKMDTITNRMKDNWNYFYDYIGFGMYSTQIEAYKNTFKDVKIFLYDHLRNDTSKVVEDTLNFLDVEAMPSNESQEKVFNISGVPKNNIYSFLWRLKKIAVFKKLLRVLLPSKLKNRLNNFMLSRSLKRVHANNEQKDILREIYSEEINKLQAQLKFESINQW